MTLMNYSIAKASRIADLCGKDRAAGVGVKHHE